MNNIKIRVIDCHITYYHENDYLFLLLKRANNKIYPGIWQGVTGKIDNNELPFQTAIRELDEETKLTPKQLWTIDQVNMFYDAKNNLMNLIPIFGVRVETKNVVLSNEHVEYKWCNINEAIKLLTWEQQKKGLKIFYDMLKENKKRLEIMELKI